MFTFIDTMGAYPGIGAEERGQSKPSAATSFRNGPARSAHHRHRHRRRRFGGALAIGVADQVLMLQFSACSVISPEGCASILWKTAERASDAAEALGITAHRLKAWA